VRPKDVADDIHGGQGPAVHDQAGDGLRMVEQTTDGESGQTHYQYPRGDSVQGGSGAGSAVPCGWVGNWAMHFRDEAVSLSWDRFDVTRVGLVVFQNLPNLTNGLLDGIYLLLAAPHLAQQFGFGHHAVTIPDEELKRREGFGGESGPLCATAQRPELPIQLKFAETSDRLVGPIVLWRHIQGHSG
jgi:hypothetical protein